MVPFDTVTINLVIINLFTSQLSCPADDLYIVKGNLEKANITVRKASATWEPKNKVLLTAPEQDLVDRIFTKLQDIEEIEEIYDNLETLW